MKIIALILLMVSFSAAQKLNETRVIDGQLKRWTGKAWASVNVPATVDTASLLVSKNKLTNEYRAKDSTVSKIIAGSNITATKNGSSGAWTISATGGPGSTDTTSLSNRIDARVKYSDTTSLVAMQWELDRKLWISDTTGKWAPSGSYQAPIANLVDTSKYIEIADTSTTVVSRSKLTNEYFAKDSTVSKIVAGSNITATKNGSSGAWTITATSSGSSDTLVRKREMQYLKNAGAATGTSVGMPAAPTLSGAQFTSDDTYGPYLKHTTNTTNNNFGGVTSAFTVVRGDWNPELHARVQMDTAANTTGVWWVGFSSAAMDSNGRPNYHLAAFRYHTLWDNTAFWRCVTIAGTGSTNETTVTTVATAINTPYNFSIYLTSTGTRFFVNGTLVATHTSVIPTATTLLGYVIRVANVGTTKHNIRWSRIAVRHN